MTRPDIAVIQIKPYTIQELAGLYGVSKPTLRKWLKPFHDEIGQRVGNYYTIAQVKTIFSKLSLPSKVKLSEDFEEIREERAALKMERNGKN